MWFYCIVLSTLLVGCHCAMNSTNCLEKEKSLGVLELSKQSIDNAKHLFPNCSDGDYDNSTGCDKKEKALAFLEIAKTLISEAQKTYPTCPDVKRPEVEPPTSVEPTSVEPTSVELSSVEPTSVEPTSVEHTTVVPTTVGPTTVGPPVILKEKAIDCTDVLRLGYRTSNVYQVWPRTANMPGLVYCDMDTDGGGWTVIQRRGYDLKREDFYQDWETYKTGFGDIREEFWLGNENIHLISKQGDYEVRIDLSDFEGNKRFAVYKHFRLENEANGYTLRVGTYSGDAGDSLSYDSNNVFSTKDRQNGKTNIGVVCTTGRKTGWWFDSCNKANINGIPRKDHRTNDWTNLYWKEWKVYESLATADMKLRRI